MTETSSRPLLLLGDCLDRLREMPDNSVDSVVTDPPYGLSFMGKKWDYDVPSEKIWRECLRVLKPGGHLLAFAGTRTQHRMAVRIEDAGFEIRDMITWVYGSGFPKSLDVSKAIDKAAGAVREKVPATGGLHKNRNMNDDGWSKIGEEEPMMDGAFPATETAKQWQGWGTALKPAFESLTYATKPLDSLGYCSKMIANLNEKIESCRQNANNAEKSLRPSLADFQEVRINTAPESAVIHTGEALVNEMETGLVGDTNLRAATSESILEEEHTDLNTLLSWKNTLEGVFNVMRMSTTVTVFETITDWKILSYCLSQITLDSITKARLNPSGLSADALRAMEYLNVSLACCKNTLALSALESAMSQEAENCRDVGASPNLNPIIVARKPLGEKTVAANVLKHRTGGINVDGCRVGTDVRWNPPVGELTGIGSSRESPKGEGREVIGRWPANLIHDGSDEVVGLFPESKSTPFVAKHTNKIELNCQMMVSQEYAPNGGFADTGSAARFFYCAKASKKDRDEGLERFEQKQTAAMQDNLVSGQRVAGDGTPIATPVRANTHPTVKPTALMRYLCRLVTPPEGIVLDPFMGSGSTGKAAVLEGFKFIGIERDEEYIKIAESRIAAVKSADAESA